jgi:hypothetical protein
MKKLLIILVLLSFKISIAQFYPLAYKIELNSYSKFKSHYTQSDNIPKVLGRYTAAPVSSPTIISNFISDIIVVSSSAGDTIWFGTGKGISRTTNRGASFENFYGTEPFKDDDVSGIAIYRNWVVVSTAYSQIVNEEHVPTGTGIKVSSDYGATWTAYPQPVDPLDSATTGVYTKYGNNLIHGLAVVVEEQNLSYDINITRKNTASDSLVFWIASWAGGIRKSTDFGASWQRVILPPDVLDSIYPGGTYNFEYNPLENGNHKGFALTAINDSTIFAGTSGGINVSTDWGVSWKKYRYGNTGSGTGITGNFVVGLKVQRFANKIIVWGATNPGEGESNNGGQFSGISYTTNAGLNWANTLEGAFSHNLGFKDSIVYAATDDGIWRSYFNPAGFNWSKPSIIYDETIRDQIRTNFFYSVSGQGDSVWVGSGDGLARTVDTLASPWVSKWKIFRAFQNITSTNETYAAPNPFSPDDEVCRIYYKTGKTSSNITIKIFNFAMEPVRTVIQNASRTSPDVLWATWDGKRNDGSQVVNGVYFYRIEIDKDETVWGKILVLQ